MTRCPARRTNSSTRSTYAAVTTFWNLAFSFTMVVLIAAISSDIGIRKVLRIEPFDIFRG